MQPNPSKRSRRRAPEQSRLGLCLGHCASTFSLVLALSGASCERSALTDGLPGTTDCSSCHGRPGDPAPPTSVTGGARTSELGVGAHQPHLASSMARQVACTECHVIPSSLLNHPDPLGRPAPVVFGPTAAAAGATPTWDRTSAACANSYCHGATLPEAETRAAPVWTRVDGTQKTCTSCHGNPPGGTHPASATCENCHSTVMGPGGAFANPSLHIDGKVDVGQENSVHPTGYANPSLHGPDTYRADLDCRRCHGAQLEGTDTIIGCDTCHQQGWRTNCIYCHGGTLESSGAPPRDLLGGTATTSLGVGSHTEHVSRTTHPAYACTECHAPVTDVMTPEHLFDSTPGRSEIVFGYGRSPAGQYAAPGYGLGPPAQTVTSGCSDVYCHGTGLTNGSAATFVPAGDSTCVSCHPAATQSSGHAFHAAYPCNTCHLDVVADSQTVSNPELHVNGTVEVTMSTGTWIADTNTCSGSVCHASGDITW